MGVASERLNGVKQSGSRTIREPTWYFQSKLLVSYNRKDNMADGTCQENQDTNLVRNSYSVRRYFLSFNLRIKAHINKL
ncbi:MAG TPA: hypothetical protein VFS61_12055 [Anaerolineales bacterium]|nr:hypothetical protein [Anaerolineales bacterium]